MFHCQILFLVCAVLCCTGDQFENECGLEPIASTPLVRGGLGGVKAKQFPWHVAIFHREKNNQFEQACGGSLVRSNLVISAAHCFSDRAHSHQVHLADYRIVAGVRLSSWDSTEIGRQQSEVREVRLGQEYGASIRNYQDDISIIQLTTRFTFSDTVRAVCLDLADTDLYTNQTSPGTVGKVAGWGLTESGAPSDRLNFLGVPVVAREKCLDTLPYGYKAFFTSDKICAGLTNGTAVCQGDSGGGLVFPLQNISAGTHRWFLRGVLSNAPSSRNLSDLCLANFALYTNIYRHRTWLTTQMDDNLREGCRVRGSAGVCREYSACPTAIEEAARGILPQKCDQYSFGTEGQLICCSEPCPPLSKTLVSQQRNGSKAADYCIELAEHIYPCQRQRTSTGWARGNTCPAIPEPGAEYDGIHMNSTTEAPYFGELGTGEEGNMTWQDVVILLSDRWLMASAYAFDLNGPGNIKYVALGGRFNPYSADVIYNISKVVIHPEYNYTTSTAYNDIALVEVDRRITFSSRILPACLHTGTPLPNSGLIHTGLDSKLNAFVKTSMKLVPQEECSRVFFDKNLHPDGVHHQTEICSRPVSTSGPCKGLGTGSPLSLYNGPRVECTHLLVGIESTHDFTTCTIIYSRISGFISWIESIVWA